jgi:NADP-dependent 3-hydroxy acid dehydrogenase YdfG
MMTLEGRVVVVTGASGGIGAGLAAMLAEAGARVVLASRREAALERVATDIRRSGGSALPIVTYLARDDSLANLVAQTRAELGQLDILVNNAGYASRLTPSSSTTPAMRPD